MIQGSKWFMFGKNYFIEFYSTTNYNPDYNKLAESFGMESIRR